MISLLLALQLTTYHLSSEQADYDGKTLIFSDHFQITHPMGRLSADKATLRNLQLRGPTKKPAQLFLEENVEIEVPEGQTPFVLKAKKALCELLPSPLFSTFQFQEVHFFDHVEIRTLHNLIARGGSALYKIGALTLFPSLPTTYCQLLRNGDRIDAKEIRIDLLHQLLSCDQPIGTMSDELEFSADELIWNRIQRTLRLNQNVEVKKSPLFNLKGETGLITCSADLTPETLRLSGHVLLLSSRIKNKESFAAADSVHYNPKEKLLVFSCEPPKRVLFWQEGLDLSASEVRIHQETETIEGLGDVHFAFDVEEKNTIEKLISNYL